MNESLVQWTLLNNVDYLSEALNFEIASKRGLQKKVLLRVITNGNWTAHKVNIYWFLRFMDVTNGEWIPNFS